MASEDPKRVRLKSDALRFLGLSSKAGASLQVEVSLDAIGSPAHKKGLLTTVRAPSDDAASGSESSLRRLSSGVALRLAGVFAHRFPDAHVALFRPSSVREDPIGLVASDDDPADFEPAYSRVKVRYVDDLQDLKRQLANMHLWKEHPRAVVLDDFTTWRSGGPAAGHSAVGLSLATQQLECFALAQEGLLHVNGAETLLAVVVCTPDASQDIHLRQFRPWLPSGLLEFEWSPARGGGVGVASDCDVGTLSETSEGDFCITVNS